MKIVLLVELVSTNVLLAQFPKAISTRLTQIHAQTVELVQMHVLQKLFTRHKHIVLKKDKRESVQYFWALFFCVTVFYNKIILFFSILPTFFLYN
jgi:hypothetical protein